jgi:ribosomal protein L11 methylase PrmA
LKCLLFEVDAATAEYLVADLQEAGSLGVEEQGAALRAYFEDHIELAELQAKYGGVECDVVPASQVHNSPNWDPVLAGDRFFIAPPGLDAPAPPGRIRLTIDAGSAFGTGRHETTQMMLETLERADVRGRSVVDIGCGSGILTEAALMLGAERVFACDIDLLYLSALPEHLRARVFVGSADGLADRKSTSFWQTSVPKSSTASLTI